MENISFSSALDQLKKSRKVTREHWKEYGIYIELDILKDGSKFPSLYICMRTNEGAYFPWIASHTDILSNDWSVVR